MTAEPKREHHGRSSANIVFLVNSGDVTGRNSASMLRNSASSRVDCATR